MNDRNRRNEATSPRRDDAARTVPRARRGGDRAGGPSSARAVLTVGRGTLAAGMGHRPVDVICAGMYRACSTWQYEVVAHLVEHHRGGCRLGYLTPEQYAAPVDPSTAGGKDKGVSVIGWRVFKSHDGDWRFARAVGQGRAVVIYAYRDVRDVVFSLMHKRRLTFEQLLRQGMIHQVLANDRFWIGQPNVLVQRYDDILSDPVGAVRDLARHLGIKPSAGEAERIADEYSLAANKARTDALRRRLEQGGVDLNEASNSLICDSTTLLHWNHVRDGRSGSWFAESTPRQRLILERMCGRWLRSRGYSPVPDGADRGANGTPSVTVAERVRIELEVLGGWISFRMRAAAQRFPRLAATARRVLGIADPTRAGATVWSESKADH